MNPIALHAETIAKSGPSSVALLEVFSSEGCSSCPPAEEWASHLAKDSGLWKDFVPVVFHVDYWDNLGWKDRFSDNQYTQRQKAYADAWGSGSIYTPGFVLNGKEWRDWYGARSIEHLHKKDSGILAIDRSGAETFIISFTPDGALASSGSYHAHAALLGSGIVSEISAGENTGRRLKHDFTVLDYAEKDMKMLSGGRFEQEFVFKSSKHPEIKDRAIAAWVTSGDNVEPLQSTGADL